MKNKKALWQVINEKHTEYCSGSGIGYELEQVESATIDNAITALNQPTLAEILAFTPLENMRNSDKESADDLLKKAVERWIGAKCLDALANNKEFVVSHSYLETLSVCIELSNDWQSWLI